MSIVILPYEGIDGARLNATREDVRRAISDEVRPYKKGGSDADQFLGKGIHAYYDSQNRCRAFEIYAPASVDLFGNELIGRPHQDAERLLRSLDGEIEIKDGDARSRKLGVALNTTFKNGPVEGVLVVRRGYWEEPLNPVFLAELERIRKSAEDRFRRKRGQIDGGSDPKANHS